MGLAEFFCHKVRKVILAELFKTFETAFLDPRVLGLGFNLGVADR